MSETWGVVAEWVSAGATLIAAYAARDALSSWRDAKRSDVAATVLESAILMRELFYETRNSFFGEWEFPDDYVAKIGHTSDDIASATLHAYQRRWELLRPQFMDFIRLRARVAALLKGQPIDTEMEKLARIASKLPQMIGKRVKDIRNGILVDSEGLEADIFGERSDPFSQEFDNQFRAVEAMLRQYI